MRANSPLRNTPRDFAAAIMNSLAEATMDFMIHDTQHAALYSAALKNLGHSQKVPSYSLCTGCGATWAGRGPDVCPTCGRHNDTFQHVK